MLGFFLPVQFLECIAGVRMLRTPDRVGCVFCSVSPGSFASSFYLRKTRTPLHPIQLGVKWSAKYQLTELGAAGVYQSEVKEEP